MAVIASIYAASEAGKKAGINTTVAHLMFAVGAASYFLYFKFSSHKSASPFTRARIQLASSLRNLGHLEEGSKVLSSEFEPLGGGLDDAVVLFQALLLTDLGYEREAVAALVHALASHLPRYVNSAHRYADLLLETAPRQAKLQHTDEVEK